MRTAAVRFSEPEHRLLRSFAAAQGVSLETLVREALALAPIDARPNCARRLQAVGEDEARAAAERQREHAVPAG
jgi:hypothetical protein